VNSRILAGRELALSVRASEDWLRGQRDDDGLWTQRLYGEERRFLGPAHGFAGCVLALGDVPDVSETLRRHAVVEGKLANWPPLAGRALDDARDRLIRVQWCHGAPGIVATLAHLLHEELSVAAGS
jgi:Lanthionine synthetase C-like protein